MIGQTLRNISDRAPKINLSVLVFKEIQLDWNKIIAQYEDNVTITLN
jgi:hypothetical protein